MTAAVRAGRTAPGRGHTHLQFQTCARSLQHLPALSASFLLKAAFPRRIEEESMSASTSHVVLLLSADSLGTAIKNLLAKASDCRKSIL